MLALAVLLGLVEGLTEFIPVSSTGHLILLGDLLGFRGPPGRVFEVVIQLGAILAVCFAFRRKIILTALGLRDDPAARRFAAAILIGFLPAAVVGALALDFIKTVLFSPYVVAVALILGGFAILWIERHRPEPRVLTPEAIGPWTALKIGLCQCVAMIPGVSRSGATIMGSVLMGVDRKAATEFSFFLAIPTMLGATVLDLAENASGIDRDGALVIAAGFLAAFLAALLVVRTVVAFVARHGFAPFAWYRIALGAVMLTILALR